MHTETLHIPVADDVLIHVAVTGSGPAIVLIHGLTLDHRMWDDQVAAFAATNRVIAIDLRGYGQSTGPNLDQAYTHAADVKAVLDHLGIASAAIVGLSMGGWPAVDFALAWPEATDALVLVDSTLYGYEFEPGYGGRLRALFTTWPQDRDAAIAAWLADPLFAGSRANPATVARLTAIVNDCHAPQLSGIDAHIQPDCPIIERLREINVPTLVVVGEQDLPDFHTIARTLGTGIPNARFLELPDAGHMANMDTPVLFNQILGSFLGHHQKQA